MNSVSEYLDLFKIKGYNTIVWDDVEQLKLIEKYTDKENAVIINQGVQSADGRNLLKFYNAIHKDINISLFMTLRYDDSYFEKTMEWIENNLEYFGKNILDIGCSNGLITCFIAKLLPDSRVIGIDMSENAVKVAINIADKLQLTNVEFITGMVNEIKGNFDTVFSSRTMQENVFPVGSEINLLDYEDQMAFTSKISLPYAKMILNLLKEDGNLISIERLGKNPLLYGWMNSLIDVKLYPKLESFEYWNCDSKITEDNHFTVFVTSQTDEINSIDLDKFYCNLVMPVEPNYSVPITECFKASVILYLNKEKLIDGYYFLKNYHVVGKQFYWSNKKHPDSLLCLQVNLENDVFRLSNVTMTQLDNVVFAMKSDNEFMKNQGYLVKRYTEIHPDVDFIMNVQNPILKKASSSNKKNKARRKKKKK